MQRLLNGLFACLLITSASAQKKALDHSVYDGWKSLGERSISNDGKFAAFVVVPQEGDGVLYLKNLGGDYTLEIPRGYAALFTNDSRYLVCKIKPFFKESREARIKKKKADDMPKDSLIIVDLIKKTNSKLGKVKSFKLPKEGASDLLAYLLEKGIQEPVKKEPLDSLARITMIARIADSLQRVSDSLRLKLLEVSEKGLSVLQPAKKEVKSIDGSAKTASDPVEEGTELVLMSLSSNKKKSFPLVSEYYFNENGEKLLIESTRKNSDTSVQSLVTLYETTTGKLDTLLKKFNDAKNYTMDKEGTQVAFVAERDSAAKSLVKHYKLWYFSKGQKEASVRVERGANGLSAQLTVSSDYANQFSKDGQSLFFGISQVRKPKDTSLVDFETARLDVWHPKDDYLQPQQLLQVQRDLKKSMVAVLTSPKAPPVLLGSESDDELELMNEGNAPYALAVSSKNSRIESQWQGFTLNEAFLVDIKDGSRKRICGKVRAGFNGSPEGKYIYWYDWKARNYFSYEVSSGVTRNISSKVNVPLWDEEDDHPDDPPPHGVLGWTENDEALLVYDKYDIWKLDPAGLKPAINLTNGWGRTKKLELRYLKTDLEERFLKSGQQMVLKAFNTVNKNAGFYEMKYSASAVQPTEISMSSSAFPVISKAKNSNNYLIQRSTIKESELYASNDLKEMKALSSISSQQTNYNWLDVELVKWKMFDGKESEGLLYKPENFDPKKKYPVIFYFYERDADGLYNYRAPAPSASTVNIPYFVSNGYLVFDPNIYYKNGDPGGSAYNSVVSAAQFLAKKPWVDATKMAIQGQSWGGYQVAYLVTRTNLFAAAGAGAPVANMTSAYGGIRWGSGLNRQFQYERTQTRIGATLWERQDLYLKNSPLFYADKIKTPLLIMHNDKDGAVPWYQGIEFFTALRRLGKTAWLLEYNDEDHNLVERRNRKDLSVRLGQFFDHYLKGAPMPVWMSKGVPATEKGIEWGLEIDKH
jgi:dipeptidyl aminopeptidase/acylaminoacyl peptidase